jgi:hypothetical protein
MNKIILWRMLQEEIRLNTSFASGRGFYSFPLLVAISGFLAVIFTEQMIADMGYFQYLEILHIGLMFYGIFAGSLAFFGNEFLERIFGYLGMIIGLPNTQPITQRKITLLYFIKEFIFYSFFTLIPAFIGGIIGAYYNDINLLNLTKFSFALCISFLSGLSFAYLISSLYRISWKASIVGGGVTAILYIILFNDLSATASLEWYLNHNLNFIIIAILIPIILAIIATLLITDYHEQAPVQMIGYQNRLYEYIQKFRWAQNISDPAIISKERIDLQRSKTGIKMFFSFAFPLGILTFMNWFIDKGLPVQIDFNTIFYGVMVGFFGTMIYSWLNTIDSPNFYSTLPISVSDVVRARLVLFFTITWWIPLLFLTLISYMSSELTLLPIGIIVMITVGMYIVNYTAWSTGLKTNSALFDSIVFLKFFIVSVPPMIAMTILSLAIQYSISIVLISLSSICAILALLSIFFYNRIEAKWFNASFD